MSDNPISIKLEADIKDFIKGLYDAEKATTNFGRTAKQGVASAVPALNSLGQVARDLPFGFIAIQNNLPIVFDQFGALITSSKGVGGAFKELGKALIGPAGLTFAIGAIIAGITSLVQKYGSLDNALKVLTSGNAEAAASQIQYTKEINKNEAGIKVQTYTLNQYVKTLKDSNASRNEQLAAFEGIKKIQPDIVAGIAQENALTSTNIGLIESRTTAYIEFLKVQAKSNALSSVIETNEKKILDLQSQKAEAQQKINDIEQERASIKQNIPAGNARDEKLLAAGLGIVGIENSIKDYERQIKNLENINNGYFNSLDPLIQQTGAYNKQQAEAAARARQLAQDQAAAGAAAKKLADDYARAQEKMLKARGEDTAFVPIINVDRVNYEDAVKKLKDLYNRINKSAFEEARKTQGTVKGGIQVIPSATVQKAISDYDLLKQKGAEYADTITNFLSPAIDSLFSSIESGENIFKALGNSLKQLLVQLVATVAKAAILAGIFALISGGTGTAAKGLGAAGFGKGFMGNFTKILGFGGAAAPSVGNMGGMQGGLQLAGNVVFVQKGYDLVGVLNASRTSINNVG